MDNVDVKKEVIRAILFVIAVVLAFTLAYLGEPTGNRAAELESTTAVA